jgi:hypothetical protein
MGALVLVVGGSKIEQVRPYIAFALSLAIPVVPVALALKRLEGGDEALERAAGLVGWAAILAAEACVAGALFHVEFLGAWLPLLRAACVAAALAGLVVHLFEAKRLGKARFAGYVGLVAGFGAYLANHVGRDPYASVFGAFFVGVIAGGGAGLLLGELLSRVFAKASG